jgi:MbtH protein
MKSKPPWEFKGCFALQPSPQSQCAPRLYPESISSSQRAVKADKKRKLFLSIFYVNRKTIYLDILIACFIVTFYAMMPQLIHCCRKHTQPFVKSHQFKGIFIMKDDKIVTIGTNWSMDGDEFVVLINNEGQHSLWPSAQPVPQGWNRIGPIGSKAQCLAFVEENWTDMRPVSLQKAMAGPAH